MSDSAAAFVLEVHATLAGPHPLAFASCRRSHKWDFSQQNSCNVQQPHGSLCGSHTWRIRTCTPMPLHGAALSLNPADIHQLITSLLRLHRVHCAAG